MFYTYLLLISSALYRVFLKLLMVSQTTETIVALSILVPSLWRQHAAMIAVLTEISQSKRKV